VPKEPLHCWLIQLILLTLATCCLVSLQTLFPGLWLTEITADAYKVPDE
jgi:hypothetical protein